MMPKMRVRSPVAFMAFFAFVVSSASGCPTPCSADGDCNEGDVCVVADGNGTCVSAGSVPSVVDAGTPPADDDGGAPEDAGELADAGASGDDAGVVDAGNEGADAGPQLLRLRGGIEVGPGVLRGGTKALKGRVFSPGGGTARGGTFKIEAQGGGAPP